jgi:L-seryl-tRNA(Ser) seleniumtransferase
MAGDKDLVARIRARGYEMGLEARPLLYPAAYRSLAGSTPERVRELAATTRKVTAAVHTVVGKRLHETAVISELLADDILEIAMERAGVEKPPIVPYEAATALAMLLLRDHGVITVQFVGIPPGTSAIMFKFIDPQELDRFGGADAYARAIDQSLTKLATLLRDPGKIRALVFGE